MPVTSTLTAGAWLIAIGADRRAPSALGAQPAADVYAWGAQVQTGTWVTTYIPTPANLAVRRPVACR